MTCKGKTHGHNYEGGVCQNCGGLQTQPKEDKFFENPFNRIPKKKSRAYTPEQELARQISEHYNEPKKFMSYMGLIKRLGYNMVEKIFKECKASKNDKVYYFFYKCKNCNVKWE